ncbi:MULTISPECIES: hypothetical protein [unclassified Nocardia]|uniref:hypothetical protein n=1 Tax=unclassified Nocardia TaxID=2637762 RepID=UPI001D0C7DC8|nr:MULTISPECIES: hypothetical protein [unclassified Nocardia]
MPTVVNDGGRVGGPTHADGVRRCAYRRPEFVGELLSPADVVARMAGDQADRSARLVVRVVPNRVGNVLRTGLVLVPGYRAAEAVPMDDDIVFSLIAEIVVDTMRLGVVTYGSAVGAVQDRVFHFACAGLDFVICGPFMIVGVVVLGRILGMGNVWRCLVEVDPGAPEQPGSRIVRDTAHFERGVAIEKDFSFTRPHGVL